LITGSYTPFLGITFSDKPVWSVYMLSFLWVCCMGGIYIEAFMSDDADEVGQTGGHCCGHHRQIADSEDEDDEDEKGKEEDEKANDGQRTISKLVDVRTRWKANLSLGMYLGMGW
jgi:hypothetical protein